MPIAEIIKTATSRSKDLEFEITAMYRAVNFTILSSKTFAMARTNTVELKFQLDLYRTG